MNTGFVSRMITAVVLALLLVVLMMVLGIATEQAYGSTTTVSRYTGATYTHNSAFANAIIIDGVDVSYVQQNKVDWEKAKADGVDFAIIRVGARGYGQAGKLIVDDYYKENIEAAQDAGIMVGVYFFSQALNEIEAWAEANYTLELIEGYDLDLPVYMDYEFSGGSAGRLTNAQLSKLQMTQNAEAFCQKIEEAGYEAGFYANRNFLNNTVDGKAIGQKWDVWVAQYNTYTDYAGDYHMWQYSSSGYIDGYSGRVDVNFMYLDPNPTATSTLSVAESTVTIVGSSSYTYSQGTIHEPSVRVTQYGIPLTEGVDYEKYYLKNSQAGTAYVLIRGKGSYTDYKLVPFTINPTTNLSGITVDRILNKYYTGKARVPSSITVRDASGNTLTQGVDYTFSVANATEVGTATVTIKFMGNYSGTKTVTYQILTGKQTVSVKKSSYEVATSDGVFYLEGITASAGGKLTYKSSDESVVTVDKNGLVTPVGKGNATITVTAAATDNYGEASAEITISVTQPAQVITTGADSYTKTRLSKAFHLNAASDAGTELVYESLNPSVAKVEQNGRVTLMGSGTAEIVISAPAADGYAAAEKRVTITVGDMDEETFTEKYESLKSGIEGTRVVLLKANPEAKKVKLTWKKSNSGYAVDYYQVWRSFKKSSGYKKIFTTSSGSSKSYTNTKDVQPGTTYWYKVRGVRNLEGTLVYTDFVKIEVTTPEA